MSQTETFIDTHCHLLPGVDDGAGTWDEAMAMARLAVADGISVAVVTPHQLGTNRQLDGPTIRAKTAHLQEFLNRGDVPLRVLPGAEVRVEPDLIENVRDGEVLTLADRGRYVLLELPHEVYLPLDEMLLDLRRAGLTGILAHVERNRGVLAQPAVVASLVDAGCLLQVTAGSITGSFGTDVQKLAWRLIERGQVHFVATDAHGAGTRRPQIAGRVSEDRRAGRLSGGVRSVPQPPGRRSQRPVDPVTDEGALAETLGTGPLVSLEQGRMTQSRRWWLRMTIGLGLPMFFALLAAPCRAADWVDVRVAGPFVVRADFPLAGLEGLLGELARLQNDLARSLGVRAPSEPIGLCLFRNEQTYRAYLGRHFPTTPYRRALFVKSDGPGQVLVHRNSQFAVDIRHECTHALLHSTLPMVPLWLDEGLAEYFEVPPRERASDNPYLKSVKWAVRFGMVASMEELEHETDFSKLSRNDYRDSWAWVHFMLHGPAEARHELIAYLADIQASTPPGTLSGRLARRLPNLRSRMAEHFKTWQRWGAKNGTGPILGSEKRDRSDISKIDKTR